MVYYGAKGGSYYPEFKRARLLSGEKYVNGEGTGGGPGLSQSSSSLDTPGARRSWSGQVNLTSTNAYGLTSRSEFLFPEAFKPVDTKFWQPLKEEERAMLISRQAQANLKATFDDDDARPLASTAADAAYADAQSQRSQAMKRRRRPRNLDERRKFDEMMRKEPLQRRYNSPELIYRESSAIISSGALDAPILVNGLPVAKTGADPESKPLKRKRGQRIPPSVAQPAPQPQDEGLPMFNPNAAPKAKISGYLNPYGLVSRSEMDYPEAYREVSTIYWRKLSDKERNQVMRVQAVAMEKVGYERGTEKRFIEDIEPLDDYQYKNRGRRDDTVGRASSGMAPEQVVFLLFVLAMLAGLGYVGWTIYGDPARFAPPPVTIPDTDKLVMI